MSGINEKLSQFFVGKFTCCRCSRIHPNRQAILIKYGAPFCSEDCAKRAGDFSLEFGADMIRDFDYVTAIRDFLYNTPEGKHALTRFEFLMEEAAKSAGIHSCFLDGERIKLAFLKAMGKK